MFKYIYRHGRIKFAKNFHNAANASIPITQPIYYTNQKLNELWKSGRITEARNLFDEMPERDEFTYNTMIAGYANSGNVSEAQKLFNEMQCQGFKPSMFTLGSVLRMCSMNGLLLRGEQVHGYVIKTQFDENVFVSIMTVQTRQSQVNDSSGALY